MQEGYEMTKLGAAISLQMRRDLLEGNEKH